MRLMSEPEMWGLKCQHLNLVQFVDWSISKAKELDVDLWQMSDLWLIWRSVCFLLAKQKDLQDTFDEYPISFRARKCQLCKASFSE